MNEKGTFLIDRGTRTCVFNRGQNDMTRTAKKLNCGEP